VRLSNSCALGASLALSINDIIVKSFSGSFPRHEVVLARAQRLDTVRGRRRLVKRRHRADPGVGPVRRIARGPTASGSDGPADVRSALSEAPTGHLPVPLPVA